MIMPIVKEVSTWLLTGIGGVIQSIEDSEIEKMIDILLSHKDHKTLLLGSGRSGFVGRAFALRLMHLGFNVYVSGETITPALTGDDLVVALSGSGTTTTVVAQAEVAIARALEEVVAEKGPTIVAVANLLALIKSGVYGTEARRIVEAHLPRSGSGDGLPAVPP